jgi:DNA-binding transcriptional LysR family regulator
MEMGTLEGVVEFVEAGIGIAAMPESFIRPISKGKKVVMLSFPTKPRRCRLMWSLVSTRHLRL